MYNKHIVKFLCFFILCASLLFCCDGMNEIHEKYLQGERVYLGKIDSIKLEVGLYKVKVDWWLNQDPKIEKTVIYWNHRKDSLVVPVGGKPQYSAVIENLKETSYTFEMVNKNKYGELSIAEEMSAFVYGDRYMNSLRNRKIKKVNTYANKAVIHWAFSPSTSVDTRVTYTNMKGEASEYVVHADEEFTSLKDYKPGTEFSFITNYHPSDALHDFQCLQEGTGKFESHENGLFPLDKSKFRDKNMAFDIVDIKAQCYEGEVRNLWNGKIADKDYYHNDCKNDPEDTPYDGKIHHFTIDLGDLIKLNEFAMWPRQGGYQDRNIKHFELWGIADIEGADTTVPPDDSSWEANSKGKGWVKLLDFTGEKSTPESWKGSKDPFTTPIKTDQSVRYVRIRVLDTWNGGVATALSEINFSGVRE
ncbi:MAG: hypothetical protein MI784_09905 [Cytophagales bacterium]|nr:hypothetical protein [Cytophagales bacterium]